MAQKWPKMTKMTKNDPKLPKNYPKWPKMTQMTQYDPKWPKMTKNDPK